MKRRKRTEYQRRWWRAKHGVPLDQPVRGTEDFLFDPKAVYRHAPPPPEVRWPRRNQ